MTNQISQMLQALTQIGQLLSIPDVQKVERVHVNISGDAQTLITTQIAGFYTAVLFQTGILIPDDVLTNLLLHLKGLYFDLIL